MIRYTVLLLLLCPLASADAMDVIITLSKNDFVTEQFTVVLVANDSYDSFDYFSLHQPLSVAFDGDYAVLPFEDGFLVRFEQPIAPGVHELQFTLIYDDLVERSGRMRSFRTSFSSQVEAIRVSLSLPEHFTLADDPSVFPTQQNISTDGRHIILEWEFADEAGIALFYEGQGSSWYWFALGVVLLLGLGGAIFWVSKRHARLVITETLSAGERLVVDKIRGGVDKQKDIARDLSFSKSKMAKVVRKLEEKGLVSKEPHFKTNKLKIRI